MTQQQRKKTTVRITRPRVTRKRRTYTRRRTGIHLRKKRRRRMLILLFGFVVLGFLLFKLTQKNSTERQEEDTLQLTENAVDSLRQNIQIEEKFLTINEYSRPGISLEQVNGIVIHYTANPGSDADGNRNYFENLKDTKTTKVSSHFIIGLDGRIIQCIPLNEIAYASNDRNTDTISIECCHPDKDGKFTDETYRSLVKLSAWLCAYYSLEEEDIIRHYDVTGKNCPKYYVEHEKKWKKLKKQIIKEVRKTADI